MGDWVLVDWSLGRLVNTKEAKGAGWMLVDWELGGWVLGY